MRRTTTTVLLYGARTTYWLGRIGALLLVRIVIDTSCRRKVNYIVYMNYAILCSCVWVCGYFDDENQITAQYALFSCDRRVPIRSIDSLGGRGMLP